MLPIRDDNPSSTFPYVTIALIALNAVVFIYEMLLPMPALESFVLRAGAIPLELTKFEDMGARNLLPMPLTLLSSMFVHGGIFHIAFNMLYLWVFGDNVEDSFGKIWFVVFYLLAGIAAALTHVLVYPSSDVPMVGASGAIAGVLGAYAVLFPAARVRTLIFIFFFIRIVHIPAIVLLTIWFGMQILSSAGGGGVAWFAHIGGFAFGALVAGVYRGVRGR